MGPAKVGPQRSRGELSLRHLAGAKPGGAESRVVRRCYVARVRRVDAPLSPNGEEGSLLVVRGAGWATSGRRGCQKSAGGEVK